MRLDYRTRLEGSGVTLVFLKCSSSFTKAAVVVTLWRKYPHAMAKSRGSPSFLGLRCVQSCRSLRKRSVSER
jgi:hypothetical protein